MDVVSLAFRTDLALLRLGGSQVEDRGDHLVVRSAHNPAFWWGNFLLAAGVPAPGEAGAWLARFHDAFPSAAHVALGFDAVEGTRASLDGFAALGLNVDVSAVLTAGAVHAPAHGSRDAECRPLGSDDDWTQSVELALRCFGADDPTQVVFTTAKTRTNRALVEAGHGAWFGAFLDGRLVAQLGLLRAGGGLARFQTVETDPQFRRRGLAGALVYRASRYGLDELGARTLVMVADPEYFAIDLYRAVGFAVTETQLQAERAPSIMA